MNETLRIEIPDYLYVWLILEAKRCDVSVNELIIDILETKRLFDEPRVLRTKPDERSRANDCRK